ncbi:uncharacterized protein LOC105421972 isoform X1 [Pogonomyrmex barbatus]|uniref:Uncharacterized protein LOC105421972 isoform X1 n=1 Tax=Pogonomyrmex barbatus TaxID=144034 RepID=A0A6I9VSE8_9HYME|nr:uncharacterized protein LOC105421972 isoform X1 [Pogonomyrmex barbatus]
MKDSRLGSIMLFIIFLIFVGASDAKPLDYEDVANLLPTEPQTTNDTLTAIVQDPVVQDAVQNAVGNGSLEGLVVKKKVLVMPATEPNKVVSQREQILVVPMVHLEDVRKNITDTVNAKTDVDGLTLANIDSFIENDENGYANSESKDSSSYASQRNDFYETLTEISKTTRKPTFPIDNIPQEIPYLVSNPSQEIAPSEPPPVISVPIIAFLDPAKISNDKIDVPIVALSQDETLKNQMENERDKIQRNIQNYVDTSSLSVDLDNWRLTSFPSEMQVSPSLYESSIKETRNANNVSPENSLSVLMPRVDIVTPLFWTSDADINYSKDPHDMEVAADIVFRPLFRYRQEAQQRSYRRSTYRRYNSYNSYPRRNYRYRPRYSDYYY